MCLRLSRPWHEVFMLVNILSESFMKLKKKTRIRVKWFWLRVSCNFMYKLVKKLLFCANVLWCSFMYIWYLVSQFQTITHYYLCISISQNWNNDSISTAIDNMDCLCFPIQCNSQYKTILHHPVWNILGIWPRCFQRTSAKIT